MGFIEKISENVTSFICDLKLVSKFNCICPEPKPKGCKIHYIEQALSGQYGPDATLLCLNYIGNRTIRVRSLQDGDKNDTSPTI